MKHVRADLGRGIHAHVLDQHLLAVDHLPVAGQDEIVSDPVEERRDGLTLRQGRDRTSLEAVAAVHHECVLRILLSQGVDHRAQRGKPASTFEGGSSLLVEELVVDFELRVNVGGVQNGDVRAPSPSSPPGFGPGRPARRPDRADVLQEFAAPTQRHVNVRRELLVRTPLMRYSSSMSASASLVHRKSTSGSWSPALLLVGNRPFGISANFRHLCGNDARPHRIFQARLEADGRVEPRVPGGHLHRGGRGVAAGAPLTVAIFTQNHRGAASARVERSDRPGAAVKCFAWSSIFTVKGFALMVVGGFLVGFPTSTPAAAPRGTRSPASPTSSWRRSSRCAGSLPAA